MDGNGLLELIKQKESFLCVGLDTDLEKIPKHFLEAKDPIFEFNKEIIDATKDFCIAYKLNIAFYEALGIKGWQSLQKTVDHLPKDVFSIADAKRGDIGNTTRKYAEAFFKTMNFDAITVAPYMGSDSVSPFLEYDDKWAIILALTSNVGSQDIQMLKSGKEYVFEHVIDAIKNWGTADNTMLVVGATHPEMFAGIRKRVPDHFLLVPGVGAQGGDLNAICQTGMNDRCGLIVNSSRSIIYAGSGKDFKVKAMKKAYQFQREMAFELKNHGII